MEVVDAILGITDTTSDTDHKKAAHCAEGSFIEEGKLWKLGEYTPSRATARVHHQGRGYTDGQSQPQQTPYTQGHATEPAAQQDPLTSTRCIHQHSHP